MGDPNGQGIKTAGNNSGVPHGSQDGEVFGTGEEPSTVDFTGGRGFNRTASRSCVEDIDDLIQAAYERLEHKEKIRAAVLHDQEEGVVVVDLNRSRTLKARHRKRMLDQAMQTEDMDNQLFLLRIKERLDRVGVQLAEVEVRFRHLSVEAEAFSSGRALPSIYNSFRDVLEGALRTCGLLRKGKIKLDVIKDASGIVRPGRLTLLLGPPGCGKSTLLKALAGKLRGSAELKMTGEILYNGYRLDEFIPERTAGYVSQSDSHIAELSVRETMDFAARCQKAGYEDELEEVRRKEAEQGVQPDAVTASFMAAASLPGKRHSLMTDYILRILGLETCAETLIGNDMVRGISGGQRKRVSTGEMVVGPKKTLFLDEISTGLDSSTTFQIVQCLANLVHFRRCTAMVALLQPAPETFSLFDDIIVLCEGRIVFQGPREEVVPFFTGMGFQLPARKGVADFLQEVTSSVDQQQFWALADKPYEYVTPAQMAVAFDESALGRALREELSQPPVRSQKGAAALVHQKYALSFTGSLKACFRREVTLFARHSFVYIHRILQVIVLAFFVATLLVRTHMDTTTVSGGAIYLNYIFFSCYFMMVNGFTELTITVNNIRIFYRQRDDNFFPAVTYLLPSMLLRIPFSFIVTFFWTLITYPAVGAAPGIDRFMRFWMMLFLEHQAFVTAYRLCSAVGRVLVKAFVAGNLLVAIALMFSGFAIPYHLVPDYWVWCLWINPLYYAFRTLVLTEFTAPRWRVPFRDVSQPHVTTLGDAVLETLDLNVSRAWIGIGYAAVFCFIILFNFGLVLAFKFLSYPKERKAVFVRKEKDTGATEEESAQMPKSSKAGRFGSANGESALHKLRNSDSFGEVSLAAATKKDTSKAPQLRDLEPSRDAPAGSTNKASGNGVLHAPGILGAENGGGDVGDPHVHDAWDRETAAGTVGHGTAGPDPKQETLTDPVNAETLSEKSSVAFRAGNTGDRSQNAPVTSSRRNGADQLPPAKSINTVKEGNGEVHEQVVLEVEKVAGRPCKGMSVLPFVPVTLTFQDVCYFVDMPKALAQQQRKKQRRGWAWLKSQQGRGEVSQRGRPQLQLLHKITGFFRPGVLTALMGASGAGKTTLLDVLACRKTSGRITGEVRVNGYKQDPITFVRIAGYCEQFDIHSPQMTVREALWFSSRLRLTGVPRRTVNAYVDQVMELVELTPLADALVGLPAVSGLSVEQRKRLTIAVELVANPSIVFMDEPTSGLDARAAAIVMRAVRNIVDTGRTICCTIHQPSILLFEAFDELLLLKRGGEVIYNGPLGHLSCDLIAYFSAIPGVSPIQEGTNPATWMLDISTVGAEERMGLDLALVFQHSALCKENLERVREAAQPRAGVPALSFDTPYATSLPMQYLLILGKNTITYWRYPSYNAVRLVYTVFFAALFGSAFWQTGMHRDTRQNILRVSYASYVAVMTLGFYNAATVQPIVFVERSVFYRERYARMYASLPYAVAQGTVELPWILTQSVLYSVLVYFFSGFELNAGKFFMYMLFMFLTLVMYTSFGIMSVALSASLTVANVIATTGYALWNLMAGVILPTPRFPRWWIWMTYITPLYYTYNGLVASQLGDVRDEFITLDDGTRMSVAGFIESYFNYRWDFRGYAVLALVLFIVLFRLVAIYALMRFNFQKR